ncbi:hypothetical protein [Micromonospora inositola]|uniref:hypothetical protein n=1 Tax=Micromonospora inositola TaxID=47865 RepID=UPI0012FDE842|nr:hypothetical protein [Micromonospora inositola]
MAIIMIRAEERPRWRIAWAERENDRRRRAYDTEAGAWHRRNDQLIRLQIEAAEFLGCTQPRTGLPVDLDDDEVVYRVLPAAELVEAEGRHIVGLPTPGLTAAAASVGAPGRALPRGLRVVDVGMAVVTNHRVAFSGRERRRQWSYADMVGPAHHPDVPLTLLHTTDGSRLAGLRVPADASVNFRFYLTLAFAAATGERAAVAAQIDALLDAHQNTRPLPPPPAQPDHARLTPLRPDRLAAAAAALLAFACATLTVATSKSEQDGLPYRAGPAALGTATTGAPNAIGTTTPSTPSKLAAPDSGTAASLTGPTATRPMGGAQGVDGQIRRQGTAHRGSSSAPAVAAAGPAAHPTPTTGPASTTDTAPTTTRSPANGPAPTTAQPSPNAPVVSLCPDPLQLPIAERLLCPPSSP